MMAHLLPNPHSERASQSLPTVKCSTCNNLVPLSELGDHVCSPPRSPTTPIFLNKTSPLSREELERTFTMYQNSRNPAGLPVQLLRTGGESLRVRTLSNARRPPAPTVPTAFDAGLRSSSSSPSQVQPPLRSASKPLPPSISPPFPTQRDVKLPRLPEMRPRQASLSSNRSNNNPSPRPSAMHSTHPSNMVAPPTPSQPSVATGSSNRSPYIPVPAPPHAVSASYSSPPPMGTISGGEAGMAGVGRRGFAAVTRAAMFTTNHHQRPKFLDIDAAMRGATETPPLSAGSSHSAGHSSPFPQTPSTPDANTFRLPSPGPPPSSMPTLPPLAVKGLSDTSTTPPEPAYNSPSTRLPFFERYKNKMPGAQVLTSQDVIYETSGAMSPAFETPRAAIPFDLGRSKSTDRRRLPAPPSEASSTSNYAFSPPARMISLSTNKSRARSGTSGQSNPSSDSDSGLAYFDSDTDQSEHSSSKGATPSTPLLTSILRAESTSSTTHIRFQSGDTASTVNTGGAAPRVPGHSRDTSASSNSSEGGRPRTNSSVIAQAFGLSGTPPKDYGILGGPGVTGFSERAGRSSSVSRSRSTRSHTRHPSEEEGMATASPEPQSSKGATLSPPVPTPGARTQRSNTVQVAHSAPEPRMPRPPVRSRTTPILDRGKAVDGSAVHAREKNRERPRKVKVCVKCTKTIEDGRWVLCDAGSMLCDMCWKHMYLPKCRRCHQAIEKQAVSSSDGQLKGKYHRECFNCHVCHKPFPDKTFYVFDSKPLCAYHYHEANNSLCSAAICGQPIEGPCAVSHSGDRYHPEHFTCEYPVYPRCTERLVEYWEVDGRMLCEGHASGSGKGMAGDVFHQNNGQSSKAKKRITRFIDLNERGWQ